MRRGGGIGHACRRLAPRRCIPPPKELAFALLDVLVGQNRGAKAHAANAIRLGLTLPELAEGLVQCLMVGARR
jgi:hypothetical protein